MGLDLLAPPRRTAVVAAVAAAALLAACAPDPAGLEPPPERRAVATEGLGQPPDLVEELRFVPGHVPPPNPLRDVATPAELNGSRVLTIRSPDLAAAKVVVVGVPGFYAGINNWRTVGQELVRRHPRDLVVWAYERRGNNMEDLTGVNYAEATGDYQAALDYYFRGGEIGGRSFAGVRRAPDLAFQSEWGLGTHFRDLRAVIAAARKAHPGAAVVWMGHSMGSAWGEVFGAYDFACDGPGGAGPRGRELLDGLILVDGTTSDDFELDVGALDEAGYLSGADVSVAGVPVPLFGVDGLRAGAELLSDAGAAEIILGLELAALAGHLAPEREVASELFDRLFGLELVAQLVHGGRFRATGAGLVGLLLDDDAEPLFFARANMGRPVGGPLDRHPNVLDPFGDERLVSPADGGALYRWDDGRELGGDPVLSRLDETLELFYGGPSNFLEWYFPLRLMLDFVVALAAVDDPTALGDWPRDHDLCFAGLDEVALPAMVVAAEHGVVPHADDYDGWLAATAISDVTKLTLADHNHADMLIARDPERNPFLDRTASWLASRFGLAGP